MNAAKRIFPGTGAPRRPDRLPGKLSTAQRAFNMAQRRPETDPRYPITFPGRPQGNLTTAPEQLKNLQILLQSAPGDPQRNPGKPWLRPPQALEGGEIVQIRLQKPWKGPDGVPNIPPRAPWGAPPAAVPLRWRDRAAAQLDMIRLLKEQGRTSPALA